MVLRFDIIEDRESHMESLYQLKSETNDIYWSGYTQAPDFQKFTLWYKEQLQRPDRKIWLVMEMMNPEKIVGYLYLTFENNTVNISHGVKEDLGGKGVGTQIVNFATNVCQAFYPEYSIEAWITETNQASIKTFLKNNFIKTDKEKKCFHESVKKEVTQFNFIFSKG